MKLSRSHFFVLIIVSFLVLIWTVGSVYAVVDLLYFIATPGTDSIILTWETATELDNLGFYVRRGSNIIGPFTQISSFIVSYGDPLTGHLYTFEDTSVDIGVQYYYVLEILNADNTSDFTQPVAALIPAPTATPSITPTRTLTPIFTLSPTTTSSPTSIATITRTPTIGITTYTPTITLAPTTTHTQTPTTTLEPISLAIINFPAKTSTITTPTITVNILATAPGLTSLDGNDAPETNEEFQYILIVVVGLWLVLALFLILTIRYIDRIKKRKL